MTPTDQFIRGFDRAIKITGISKRQACIRSGVHEVTLRRFMNRETDIKLVTLHKICSAGFNMSLQTVYGMGGE